MRRRRSDLATFMILLAASSTCCRTSSAILLLRQLNRSSGGSVGAFSCRARPVPRRIPRLGWRRNGCPDSVGFRREEPVASSPRPHLPAQSPAGRRFYGSSPPTWHQSAGLFMSAVDEDETETSSSSSKTLESTWNIPGLRKEVVRLSQRCFKKIGKANERWTRAKQTVEELMSDPNATLEALENCPNVDAMELELKELQQRMRDLNALNESLSTLGKKASMQQLPPDISQLALDLGIQDQPPTKPERLPKAKGPRRDAPFRRPYRRYYSFGNIEIRVGKKAEDNDELTLSPEHRDGSDWWMHAAGCPGSHVVIRCSLETLSDEVVQDAAALAARQSKCSGSVIKVSLTRCRDITKPPGAKAGLVLLTGKVRTVAVNMKEAEPRLQRLEETVQVN